MTATLLEHETFHAHHAREAAFMRTVTTHHADPARVLDLGCGDGSSTVRLAELLPNATLTGVDLSPANIALAEGRTTSVRCHFQAGDYATSPLGEYDLIVADTVLHLIAMPRRDLFRKLYAELTPGGRLIFSAPQRCAFNTVLTLVRRGLRMVRGRWLDALLLRIAQRLHRGHDEGFLRERLAYMYIIPQFFLSDSLQQELATNGWRIVACDAYPHTSIGQMKHAVWVCERR